MGMCLYTSFKCNNYVREEAKRTPMIPSMTRLLDEALMHALENLVLPRIWPKPRVMYVDDTLVKNPPSNIRDEVINKIFKEVGG